MEGQNSILSKSRVNLGLPNAVARSPSPGLQLWGSLPLLRAGPEAPAAQTGDSPSRFPACRGIPSLPAVPSSEPTRGSKLLLSQLAASSGSLWERPREFPSQKRCPAAPGDSAAPEGGPEVTTSPREGPSTSCPATKSARRTPLSCPFPVVSLPAASPCSTEGAEVWDSLGKELGATGIRLCWEFF